MRAGDIVVRTYGEHPRPKGFLLKPEPFYSSPLFLVLNIIAGTVLIVNLQTNYKMWGNKEAYEVISASR